MQEAWRPTLQRAVVSSGGNRVVAANPSLLGVVLTGLDAGIAAAATTVLAAIPVVMAEALPVVSLMAPPPPVVAKEEKETETPATPGGGRHGSPSWSELKALGGDAAERELERPSAAHATEVVEIPSDDKADVVVELPVPSWELAVVRSKARPSSGLPEGDLEWPYPEDPSKVQFILRDS